MYQLSHFVTQFPPSRCDSNYFDHRVSHYVLPEECIGCGACEFVCTRDALIKTDTFLGLFIINPLTCDDCGDCVDKCPVWAIEPDQDWAICYGWGCPLSSSRFNEVECNVWQSRCGSCGSPLWRGSAQTQRQGWACPQCELDLRVRCPRTHQVSGLETSYPDLAGWLNQSSSSS